MLILHPGKMSIHIKNLTKQYGQQKAVDHVSFSVQKGEIVGFLGPNGAGKSTTMKIITGFLPPTEGTAEVAGSNVVDMPMSVKKKTGYLPEHNPLYHDMFVHEYLGFMAGLYGITGSRKRDRVSEMVGLCGLSAEQNKKIGMLSKGYRQRVGLAQALIHDPEVLILDEPTSGLDPNQLVEIRKLIKTVSKDKTVLFSTHILQEVEALCDRVIVINQGKIVADDRLENLLQRGTSYVIVEFSNVVTEEMLKQVDGVESVIKLEKFRFKVKTKQSQDVRSAIVALATHHNLGLVELKQVDSSLESIFSQLTKVEEASQ